MVRLAWHFDFHSHREVNIGRNPDPKGAATALAKAGVAEIITFAKGHCGYTYYPTNLKTCYAHPQMQGDPFGDMVKAVTGRKIRVLAYISFGIDGEGARHNPHWSMVSENGPSYSPDHYISVCPFTPYIDECVLPQIAEIVERYPVGGFFFDTMGALGVCYCDWCRREFKEKHGLEIPREPASPHWGVYGRFRHDRGMALLERVSNFIQQRLPGAAVGFNQIGCPPYPEQMPAGCTRLTLDFTTSTHQSRQASRCAAYGSTAPVPADIMPTIFNGGWGDWTIATPERLEQVAASIWARRCTAYIGDRLHPENRLAPATVTALGQMRKIKKRVEREFPAEDARLTPDILVLHSQSAQYGTDFQWFARHPEMRLNAFPGATDLLLDAGANYAVCAEYVLRPWLEKVRLVVLPEIASIAPATDKLLREFVQKGGQVLVTGRLPIVGDVPLTWAGVTQEPEPWQDHIYLPPWDTQRTPEPVLVRGNCFRLKPDGAQTVHSVIEPVDMRYGICFGWGISPYKEKPGDSPLLTRHSLGDQGGAIWMLGAPLFASYEEMWNWQQIHYLADLLKHILPEPLARLDSPYGQVELVLQSNAASTWAILINHGGEVFNGRKCWTRTWGPLPPYKVTLSVRDPQGRVPKTIRIGTRNLAVAGGPVKVPVTLNTIWKVVRIDWA